MHSRANLFNTAPICLIMNAMAIGRERWFLIILISTAENVLKAPIVGFSRAVYFMIIMFIYQFWLLPNTAQNYENE